MPSGVVGTPYVSYHHYKVTCPYLHALEQLQEGVESLQELLPELGTPLCGPTDEDVSAHTQQHRLQPIQNTLHSGQYAGFV